MDSLRLEKEIFLHVGYPRTGTTTLQHGVFVRHPELLYLGKPLHYLSQKIATFFTALCERPTLEWERERETFTAEVVEKLLARKPLQKVLISEEELSTGRISGVDRGIIARRLAELFPRAHVLVTLRRQEDVLASLYCHLRAESMLGPVRFSDWLEGQSARQDQDGVFCRFDYAGLLDEYARLFGQERVHVELYEDFAASPASAVRRLAGLIGVDAERTEQLLEDAGDDRHRNVRLGQRHLEWLDARKQASERPDLTVLEATEAGRATRAWLDQGPPIDVAYADGQRDRVRARFAPGNAALAARFGLDLGTRGYAV